MSVMPLTTVTSQLIAGAIHFSGALRINCQGTRLTSAQISTYQTPDVEQNSMSKRQRPAGMYVRYLIIITPLRQVRSMITCENSLAIYSCSVGVLITLASGSCRTRVAPHQENIAALTPSSQCSNNPRNTNTLPLLP